MVRVLALFALVVVAAPAIGAQAPNQPVQATSGQAVPAPVKEKKICHVEPSGTGSIMPTRTCHTQAEWEAISQSSQTQAEQMLERQQQTTYGAR